MSENETSLFNLVGVIAIPFDLCKDEDPIETFITQIEGCMDATAVNYNPDANVEDGSCILLSDVDSSSFIPEESTDPTLHDRKHDNFGVGVSGRIKASNQLSVIFEYDQSLIFLDADQSQPNLSLGFEIATGSHAFQVFLGSYRSIIPQYNLVFNSNKFWEGDIMLGFNITRMWNY